MVETELKPSIIRRTNLNYFYFEKKKKAYFYPFKSQAPLFWQFSIYYFV